MKLKLILCPIVATAIGWLLVPQIGMGQTNTTRNQGQPFIGFQSVDGTRQAISPGAAADQVDRRATDEENRPRYPYPASGLTANSRFANFQGNRGRAPVQPQVSSQMTRGETTTGNLNHVGTATAPTAQNRNQNLVFVPYYRTTPTLTRNSSTSTNANRVAEAQRSVLNRATPSSSGNASRNRPRLNEAVVQQVSSTASRINTRQTQTVARPTNRSGATVVARAPQNCVCVPNQQLAPAASGLFRQPNIPANQAPSLAGNNNAAGGYQYQPYQFQPGLGVPQLGQRGNVLTPFFRGSGVYTPLLPLFSMPSGTYLGQGIIGQPTAYVNGQPVRNLLRYVFP